MIDYIGQFFEQNYVVICSLSSVLGIIISSYIWTRAKPIYWKIIDLLWISYAGAALIFGLLYLTYLSLDKDMDFYVIDNQRAVKEIQSFSGLFYAEECDSKLDLIYYHYLNTNNVNEAMELSGFENDPPYRLEFCLKMDLYNREAINHAVLMQGGGISWGDTLPHLKHIDKFMGIDIRQPNEGGSFKGAKGIVLAEKTALVESKVRQYNFGIDSINSLLQSDQKIVFGRYLRPLFLPLFFLLIPLRIGKSVYDISTTPNTSKSGRRRATTFFSKLRKLLALK